LELWEARPFPDLRLGLRERMKVYFTGRGEDLQGEVDRAGVVSESGRGTQDRTRNIGVWAPTKERNARSTG